MIDQCANNKYSAANKDMIEYGRQCVDILEMRILMVVEKDDYDSAQILETERMELNTRLNEIKNEHSNYKSIHEIAKCAKDASISAKKYLNAHNGIIY